MQSVKIAAPPCTNTCDLCYAQNSSPPPRHSKQGCSLPPYLTCPISLLQPQGPSLCSLNLPNFPLRVFALAGPPARNILPRLSCNSPFRTHMSPPQRGLLHHAVSVAPTRSDNPLTHAFPSGCCKYVHLQVCIFTLSPSTNM